MTASKFLFTSVLLWTIAASLFAQTTISGKVIDAKTQKPIAHSELFISGTTFGCITDSLGNFQLKVPYFPCVLVADHVSYESFIKPLKKAENLTIQLQPSNFALGEVSVSGKNKRKRNLRFFYSHFIPENRNKIKILNDSILIFERNNLSFKASTNKALIVENSYLGYRIKVVLNEFEVIAVDGPNGKQIPLNSMEGGEVMQVTGYYFYEPLDDEFPDKKAYFEENRRITYFGSYRHFLKSIYDENPEQQGYEILVHPENEEAPFYHLPDTTRGDKARKFVIHADKLTINYHFDNKNFPIAKENIEDRYSLNVRKSVIYPTAEPFFIRENGTSPKLTFVIDGLMVSQSFANSLPEDYLPPRQ